MVRKNLAPAIAYLRTSSITNVGPGKDSDVRQRKAIEAFAKVHGFAVVAEFCDPAVSGADPLEVRPGFALLLDKIESNGARTVIVEDASRFARDLMVQEAGVLLLIKRNVTVITATGENLTDTQDPMKKFMRQVAGAFAELEKARLVGKLKHARDRIRAETGKCEGRKPHAEKNAKAVELAKRLHRASPKTGERRSLREISAELAAAGFVNERGNAFHPQSVMRMIEGERPTHAAN